MKQSKNIFWVLVITLSVILISCSEDSNTNPPVGTDYSSYYPLTVGSWWVMEEWRTDENFVADSLLSRDSTVIVSEEMIEGKNAKVKISFNTFTGEPYDTSYEYFENNSVYKWGQLNPFSEEEGWQEQGNFTKDKITVVDTNVTDANFMGLYLFSGTLKLNINKGTNSTVSLKNTDYSALTFNQVLVMEGDMTIPFQGTTSFSMNKNGTMYFVNNIGMSQLLSTTNTTVMDSEESEYSKQILVDWDIK
ncbi:MAG: hypothetical protein V1779_13365 [bacterium]